MTGLRTKLEFELVCSECGKALECDYSKGDVNRVSFPNAHTAQSRMAIRPCPVCIKKAREPLELMRKAFELAKDGET